MARAFAIAFLLLFVGAHVADRSGGAFYRPLSDFRYAEPAWVGYVLFALLIGIAATVGRTAWRIGNRNQFAVYVFVTLSLTVIAVTHSDTSLHHFAANLTILVLLANYAWLLDQSDKPYCLTAHLSIPLFLVLAMAVAVQAGFLLKLLDLYFMAAVMIHHHAMQTSLATTGNAQPRAVEAPPLTNAR
jgi:hypothetical protein